MNCFSFHVYVVDGEHPGLEWQKSAWLVASLLRERYTGRTLPLVHHSSLLEMFNKFRNRGGNVIWQNNSVWKALFQLGKQLSYLLNDQTVMKYLP